MLYATGLRSQKRRPARGPLPTSSKNIHKTKKEMSEFFNYKKVYSSYSDFFQDNLDFAIVYIALNYPFYDYKITKYWKQLCEGVQYYQSPVNPFDFSLDIFYNHNIDWSEDMKDRVYSMLQNYDIEFDWNFLEKLPLTFSYQEPINDSSEVCLLNSNFQKLGINEFVKLFYEDKCIILFNNSIWEETLLEIFSEDFMEDILQRKILFENINDKNNPNRFDQMVFSFINSDKCNSYDSFKTFLENNFLPLKESWVYYFLGKMKLFNAESLNLIGTSEKYIVPLRLLKEVKHWIEYEKNKENELEWIIDYFKDMGKTPSEEEIEKMYIKEGYEGIYNSLFYKGEEYVKLEQIYGNDDQYNSDDERYCESCGQSPCMCSDREKTSTTYDF